MLKRLISFGLISFFLAVFLSGCNLYKPNCSPEALASLEIIPDNPADGTVFQNLTPPTLKWHQDAGCKPEWYTVRIQIPPDLVHEQFVDGSESSYTPDITLEKASTYTWTVQPHVTGASGSESPHWSFSTSGYCAESETARPGSLQPSDGKWTKKLLPKLSWVYPANCQPYYYDLEIALDPEFQTLVKTDRIFHQEVPYSTLLNDCTTYFWRVSAVDQLGNRGPFSEPAKITVASNTECWQYHLPSPEMAVISGYVFEDICASTSKFVPEGIGLTRFCISDLGYGIHADGVWKKGPWEDITGETYQEDGIPDITVNLGFGDCPSEGFDSTRTNQNGKFSFVVLRPGTYCLSVSQMNAGLPEGIWTLPLTDKTTVHQTITLTSDDSKIIQNFGWDSYDVKSVEFEVKKDSFCRAGPSTVFKAPAFFEEGEVINLVGRNEESTWFKVVTEGVECYISTATGSPKNDPAGLPIFDPVIIPTTTPKARPKACSEYSNQQACENAGCTWVVGMAQSQCRE